MPGRIVDADANNPAPRFSDLGMSLRQADQLAVAVRSPVPPQEQDQNGGVEMF